MAVRLTNRQLNKLTGSTPHKPQADKRKTEDPKPRKRSEAEVLMEAQLWKAGLMPFCAEHRFHSERRWRFDFAWPDNLVALEIDGGLYVNGGHNRGSKIIDEHDKLNEAAIMGWTVLRVDPKKVRSGEALQLIKRALGYK
jgi:very-short-patch-repair endonuclease